LCLDTSLIFLEICVAENSLPTSCLLHVYVMIYCKCRYIVQSVFASRHEILRDPKLQSRHFFVISRKSGSHIAADMMDSQWHRQWRHCRKSIENCLPRNRLYLFNWCVHSKRKVVWIYRIAYAMLEWLQPAVLRVMVSVNHLNNRHLSMSI